MTHGNQLHIQHTHHRRRTGHDSGFTLVELLIVIVILGILATVTVFAVRGITDKSEENACAVELGQLETAQEANFALNGSYADEAGLVSNGALKSESSLYDVTLAGDGSYTIASAGDSCTGGGGGGAAAGGATAGSSITFGGVPARQYGPGNASSEALVVFGGAEGIAEWNAVIGASPSVPWDRVVFIDVADITTTAEAVAIMDARFGLPGYSFGFYVHDDVANFDGGARSLANVLDDEYGINPLASGTPSDLAAFIGI